jgi:hypothetical protein
MIFDFAQALKGNLNEYLTPLIQVILPMITNKHSADIRSSSCLALSALFDAYIAAVQQQFASPESLQEVLSACLGKLLEGLKGEITSTARACAAESLRDILLACHKSGTESPDGTHRDPLCAPTLEVSIAIAQELLLLCNDAVTRKQTKEKEFNENEGLEPEDRDAFNEELEEEDDTLTNLVDALGQLIKLNGSRLMNYFDEVISPAFFPFLSSHQPEFLQVSEFICLVFVTLNRTFYRLQRCV